MQRHEILRDPEAAEERIKELEAQLSEAKSIISDTSILHSKTNLLCNCPSCNEVLRFYEESAVEINATKKTSVRDMAEACNQLADAKAKEAE